MKRTIYVMSVVLALALLLAACGPAATETPVVPPEEPTQPVQPTAVPPTKPPA